MATTQASLRELQEAMKLAAPIYGPRAYWSELYSSDEEGERKARQRARALRRMRHLTRLELKYWPGAMGKRWVLDIVRGLSGVVIIPSERKARRGRKKGAAKHRA